ncbi:hypothetical protein [Burkholderia territorii]|uniref:Uncharacterized protein n=1 Tax=Burkholderia territorii TaxID=1503055 RepID=A0A6L3NN97_9BURK|nr:hypothetical protein [Burkholderia territorii]KAB0686348.1 hypothetical protein F7R13_01040 [Burkholderia territorii]MBM2775967.1 hypothetical protein [Burkholderia territorii]VWB73363.1 hypothetical protein BTE28158_03458 [Burkholderia territorii]
MKQTIVVILVGASAGLIAFVGALRISGYIQQRRATALKSRPVKAPTLSFHYYPGAPKGYAGYTDRNSMLQTVTDDLVDHDADWQFTTIGFAKGFLSTVLLRTGESDDSHYIFSVVNRSDSDATAIRWLSRMQTKGTDNALPSTSNLKSVVCGIASDISIDGPRRTKFWGEARGDCSEHSEEGRVSSERLRELTILMRNAEQRGESLAAGAQIFPWYERI